MGMRAKNGHCVQLPSHAMIGPKAVRTRHLGHTILAHYRAPYHVLIEPKVQLDATLAGHRLGCAPG